MSENDPNPPVADDDFPEFAEPPRQKPSPEALESAAPEPDAESAQGQVDDVLARLSRERDEGEH